MINEDSNKEKEFYNKIGKINKNEREEKICQDIRI